MWTERTLDADPRAQRALRQFGRDKTVADYRELGRLMAELPRIFKTSWRPARLLDEVLIEYLRQHKLRALCAIASASTGYVGRCGA